MGIPYERIAAELPESASQNSFLIPTSQKVAEPRVSSAAKLKKSARLGSGRKFVGFWETARHD
jgi:hypothetical protein